MSPANSSVPYGSLLIATLGAVGLALGYVLPPSAIESAMAPASTGGFDEPEAADGPSNCPPTHDPAEIQTEIDTTKAQAAFVEGQLGLIGGLPSPWADPGDGPAEETRLREEISPELDEIEGLHDWALDCDEDPCVLVMLLDPKIDREVTHHAQRIARDADLRSSIQPRVVLEQQPPTWILMRQGAPPSPDPEVTALTQHRAYVLLDRLREPPPPP